MTLPDPVLRRPTRPTSSIERDHPGCVMVLLDRSGSMSLPWAGSRGTLADGAADALNKMLRNLILVSTANANEPIRHYFDVGVLGYGLCKSTGLEGVETALGKRFLKRGIIPLPELDEYPLDRQEEPPEDQGLAPAHQPIWVRPVAGRGTPMCQALSMAGAHIYDWAQQHPDSFPPVVINITDGQVTDNGFEGADLREWAKRLSRIGTRKGAALLFNVFLSPDPKDTTVFPTSSDGLSPYGATLFDISSELPPEMIKNAQGKHPVAPSARGFAHNAGFKDLTLFLDIGTAVPGA